MPRRSQVPSYRKHKQSGQAIVTLTDGLGGRRDVLLGKHGTALSRAEYARVLAEWEAAGRSLPKAATAADLSVNEMLVGFWKHAQRHYNRPDGKELGEYRRALRPLKRQYGHTPAKDFGPLALRALQQTIADGSWMTAREKQKQLKRGSPIGCCRGVVNQRIGRIRRAFRWAVSHELIPPSVLQGLVTVEGLARGRSIARETEPVKPVPTALVDRVLPHLRPQVAAMVRLQFFSGMRPGEVVAMRGLDLDTSGKVWFYRPGSDQGPHGGHKTAWRGHNRVIALGPRAQEVLRPWLRLNLGEFLFQPREAMAAFHKARSSKRRTRPTPSQRRRRPKRHPRRAPGQCYAVASYGRAIRQACEKAGIASWHAHQLRHTKATEIRREAGLDAARAVLGHRSPVVTEVYAELDIGKAAEIMEKLG
jgi:integrase